MRPERLYLTDILEAANSIENFCGPVTFEQFETEDMRRSAVLQKLIVIGEAAARLPADFARQHPTVPWAEIAAFRNIAVHEYFAIQWEIVWETATREVPLLAEQIRALLSQISD